jgi:hypothetical protein
MKECNNSKIHISSNFILSISPLIMFDTFLQRPSLHCNTPLHFTTLHYTSLHFTTLRYTLLHFITLHPTTLHYTYRHFTSSHLHFITLSFSFTHLHFLSFDYFNTLYRAFLFCTMTNECTIILQIITLPHVSTLLRHPQGTCNQYLAKLHKYFKWSCW